MSALDQWIQNEAEETLRVVRLVFELLGATSLAGAVLSRTPNELARYLGHVLVPEVTNILARQGILKEASCSSMAEQLA